MGVGASLSEARQLAGTTVGQLSRTTRIREAIIYGIERDDFSGCGGDFYARGHIRALAAALGLDPEAVVREFDEVHAGAQQPVRASAVFKAENSVMVRDRRSPNWTTAMAVALGIVVIFGVVRVMGGPEESEVGRTAVQVSPLVSPTPPPTRAAQRAPVQQATAMVVVKATARKSSWLDVRDAKGRRIFEGTIKRGKSATWKSPDQVKIMVGRRGAVRLEVNGKDAGVLAGSGETARRTFGPGSPRPR
jgi:cytoskeletal protein RodZ